MRVLLKNSLNMTYSRYLINLIFILKLANFSCDQIRQTDQFEPNEFANLLEEAEIPGLSIDRFIIVDLDRCLSCFQTQKSVIQELKEKYPDCFVIYISKTKKKGSILMDGVKENIFHDKNGLFKKYVKQSHSI